MPLRRASAAIKRKIEQGQQELLEGKIPASALRDQIVPQNLGPRGDTGQGYTPDPDAVTRIDVRKNSAGTVLSRRRLNLIEGSGISITAADDSGNEEIDITLSSSGAGTLDVTDGTTTVTNVTGFTFPAGTISSPGANQAVYTPAAGGALPLDVRTLHATYGDHFTGAALNATWTRYTIVSGDEAYQLHDGSRMRTKLYGGANDKWYWQTAPAGDFEVQLKVAIFGPSQTLLGPAIIDSAGNGVLTALNNDGNVYIWTLATYGYTGNIGAAAEEGVSTVPWRGADVWLALRKVGTTYSARWSINGIAWSGYLTGSPAQTFTVDRIGFGRTFNNTTNWMEVDWFDVV